LDQLDQPLSYENLVMKDVVSRGRYESEELPKRPIDEEAAPVRSTDLESHGCALEEFLE
jgi:hypothetical protein